VTTADIPDVLAAPVGFAVALITATEPGLAPAAAEQAVLGVAEGRAMRRKLAGALARRPAVLADGRSPALRVVGDLLIALRKAGAVVISPPVCAACGKPLRTLQRRGEDWYCSVCIRRPGRCSACGRERLISTIDRKGQPRCKQCPDRDDRDPLAVLAATVTAADPSLTAHVISAAAQHVFSKPAHLRKLAWVVEEDPGLLTGGGAHAPIGGVLRLIDELCDAGAQAVTRPACPRCQRVVRLYRRIDRLWCCRNCVARSRAQPCARCGAVREAAARDEHGRPLCPYCLITDPANLETCAGCRRRRPVSTRTPDGPLCENCRPVKAMTCSICGRNAPCHVSKATSQPWCEPCRHRWARCSACGQLRQVRGGTLAAPLCATCARPGPGFWRSCPDCGQPGRIHHARCARCTIQRRLRDLLGGQEGVIGPQLQSLYQALADADRPGTVEGWLNKSAAPAILRDMAARDQPLTHQALDELPPGKTVEHLRAILTATGTLPPRDEHLARLERWISQAIAKRPDPDQRQLLHRYAVWHIMRRLRTRLAGAHATREQAVAAQRHIRAAVALLDWLTENGLTLDSARQGNLEAWLASAQPAHRTDAGNFVRWARRNKLTPLDFSAVRWDGPSGVIDTEARWQQARRLIHDSTLKPGDRLAGLLVLLYAQRASDISRLTLDHIQDDGHQIRMRLGREPVVLPEPLDTLVRQTAATRRGHAAIGDDGTSAWLFPGGQPGRPVSGFRMAERLRQLGIHAGPARSAALFQLATDLPAAVLARMLGIHITVAVAWQRASAGDWAAYAADISKRHQ
jgi:integrase